MKTLPEWQIFRVTKKAIYLARRAVISVLLKVLQNNAVYPQNVVLLCLKTRKNTTYCGLL